MAPDRTAACQSWICSPCCKSCVYGIFAFVLRCFFSVLRLYSKHEHSLGVKKNFFSPLSPHVKAVFFLIPCLPVLSTPLSYVCCVCMDRLMANFAGTCTSDNKGLLLLLLIPVKYADGLTITEFLMGSLPGLGFWPWILSWNGDRNLHWQWMDLRLWTW